MVSIYYEGIHSFHSWADQSESGSASKARAIELSSFSQCWQQGRHCRSPPLPPVLVYAYSNDSTSGALVINGGRVSGTLLKLHYKDA